MITSKTIKELVDKEFNVNCSKECREWEILYPRYVYYELCIEFVSPLESMENIAKTVNQRHATLINARKKFNLYRIEPFFKEYFNGYLNLTDILSITSKTEKKRRIIDRLKARELKLHYENKIEEILISTHAQINSLKRRNHLLNEEVFFKVCELPDKDFKEFVIVTKSFVNRKTTSQCQN